MSNRRGKRNDSKMALNEKDIFYKLLQVEFGKTPADMEKVDQAFKDFDDNEDIVARLVENDFEPEILIKKLEETQTHVQKHRTEMAQNEENESKQRKSTPPFPPAANIQPSRAQAPQNFPTAPVGGIRQISSPMYEKDSPQQENQAFGALSRGSSRVNAVNVKEEIGLHKEFSKSSLPEPVPTAMGDQTIDYAKYQAIIQINHNKLRQRLKQKFETTSYAKNFNKHFIETLHLGFMTYLRNTLDELVKLSIVENDSDFKQFSKETDGEEGLNSHIFESKNEKLVLTDLGDIDTDAQAIQPQFFLVKTNYITEDQKLIEEADNKEKDKLKVISETASTNTAAAAAAATDGSDDKITKKLKKEENDYTELIKHLFKTKTEKDKESENENRKVEEANKQLLNEMFGSRRSNATSTSKNLTDPALTRDTSVASTKGKKGQTQRRRITIKHLIHYLENNHFYRRSPYLHRAYLLRTS